MPWTLSLCSLTFSFTFWPKILKPASAMSATTPTRMMYSTRLAPRVSLRKPLLASVILSIVVSFSFSKSCAPRASGNGGRDHGARGLEVFHQARTDRDEGEHQREPHRADEHQVLGRHRSALVAQEPAEEGLHRLHGM